eukprot:TRINITY_DN43305_c0_g1_i1.p1 TRINITY_DN43305_c0_g1~~TRINITY_DN43305_c0_g1_i1.p1  ORF type:complete len:389 (+),score=154.63 TRINITY_DN43305_c0_g1_i1:61-1227(+)
MRAFVTLALVSCTAAWPQDKAYPLYNTAVEGLTYPMIGLGTGGYGFNKSLAKPECWSEDAGCGALSVAAMTTWLDMGGPRIDDANSYYHMSSTGEAMMATKANREDYFLLSKIGPAYALGFNDTLQQIQIMKEKYGPGYVDCILIHWPESTQQGTVAPEPSMDPACQKGNATYDEKECRLQTYRALLIAYHEGYTRCVGVSNYNVTHLEEIRLAGLPMPAINQRPFNPHRADSEGVREYCKEHRIHFNGYSPFGTPDVAEDGGSRGAHAFPPSVGAPVLLDEPVVKQIAASTNMTAAQVMIAWSLGLGVSLQPRTNDAAHMKENLEAQQYRLSASDMQLMASINTDYCDLDPLWYECSERNGYCPPQCCANPPCIVEAGEACCACADQ